MRTINIVLCVFLLLLLKNNLELYAKIEELGALIKKSSEVIELLDAENQKCSASLNSKEFEIQSCQAELNTIRSEITNARTWH